MRRVFEVLFLASPAILGAGFIAIVAFGHWLFSNSIVGVRGVIAMELLYLLLFAVSVFATVAVGLAELRKRKATSPALALIGILLGLYLLGLGFESGAAVLYAT